MWPDHMRQRVNSRCVKKNSEASLEDTVLKGAQNYKLKILDFVSESNEDLLICCFFLNQGGYLIQFAF